MKRRNLLLGIAAVPIAGTAYALSWSDIKDAVTGHVDDIIDRRKDDAFAPGHPYAMSTFREDDIGQDAAHWVRGCLLYTSPSPRDRQKSRMPSSA